MRYCCYLLALNSDPQNTSVLLFQNNEFHERHKQQACNWAGFCSESGSVKPDEFFKNNFVWPNVSLL